MLRALLYIVKVGIFVAAAVWLAEQPGTVTIDWLDYKIRIHTGLFLLALTVVILLAIFVYQFLRALVGLPRAYRRYRVITNREKGHRALALGLTAVAAGDASAATRQAERAVKLLPNDKGMPLLLKAQAERLKGNEPEAERIFEMMLENKDTAFLGVRGLLQGALDAKNYSKALELAEYGLRLYPKQKWVMRIVYDLDIRLQRWDEARKMLPRAEKAGAIDKDQSRADRVAMLMAEGEALLLAGLTAEAQQKILLARKIDPYFIPAVRMLAEIYLQNGQRKRAAKLVEKVWARNDHPDLARLWPELLDESRGGDPLSRLKWAEKLLKLKPESREAHLLMARAAIDASLWGEARSHLEKAVDQGPDARIYRLRAEVEKRSTHDEIEEEFWLRKAENAPQPKVWICRETGRIYERWHALAPPHGSFNTIVWDYADIKEPAALPLQISGGDALLEAPHF